MLELGEGLLDTTFTEVLAWTLIHSLWQGALVALLLFALQRIIPRRFSNARYLCAGFALTLCVLLPLLTYGYLLPDAAARSAGLSAPPLMEASPVSLSESPVYDNYLPWLSVLWLLGIVVLSVKMLLELGQVRQLTRQGVSAVPAEVKQICQQIAHRLGIKGHWQVVLSAQVDVPMVVGYWLPVILLPARILTGLSAEQLAMILAHEFAHIRRHDYLVNLVQTLAEILLFFHPAVWWISRQMRDEREHCCDDIAVAFCQQPLAYARALTETAALRHDPRHFAQAYTGGDLKTRVVRVVTAHHCHPDWRGRSWLALGLIGLLLGIGAVTRVQALVMAPALSTVGEGAGKSELDLGAPLAAEAPLSLEMPSIRANTDEALDLEVLAMRLRQSARLHVARSPFMRSPQPTLLPIQLASRQKLPLQLALKELRPAVALATPAPEYPRSVRGGGEPAEVEVRFTIGPDGRVHQLQFSDPALKPAFSRAVQNALSAWRFEPRREDGIAVAEHHTRVFAFNAVKAPCRLTTGSRICR